MYLEIKDELIPSPEVMFARRREIQLKIWGPPKQNCIVHRPLTKSTVAALPPPEPKAPSLNDTKIPEWGSLPPGPISILRIIWLVAAYYNITRAELTSSRRLALFTRPRQVAAYLARRLTERSYPDIGKRLGGRDHTTILHAFRTINRRIQNNPSLAFDIHLLETTLLNLKTEWLKALEQRTQSTSITSLIHVPLLALDTPNTDKAINPLNATQSATDLPLLTYQPTSQPSIHV